MKHYKNLKKPSIFMGISGTKIAILSLVLVTILVPAVLFIYNVKENVDLDLDPNAQLYSGEEPENIGGAETGVAIPGYGELSISANTQNIDLIFLNPSSNGESEKTYYLTFELILKDTGESLWKSGKVRPGYSVNQEVLKRALSAGTYDVIIKTQPYTADGATANSANMETTLVVE